MYKFLNTSVHGQDNTSLALLAPLHLQTLTPQTVVKSLKWGLLRWLKQIGCTVLWYQNLKVDDKISSTFKLVPENCVSYSEESVVYREHPSSRKRGASKLVLS